MVKDETRSIETLEASLGRDGEGREIRKPASCTTSRSGWRSGKTTEASRVTR
jgi:hypothetical protein